MNKTELVNEVASQLDITKKEAANSVGAVLDAITGSLNTGEKVSLVGFGVFECKQRNERTCRNPQTGQDMVVPAKMAPKFRASKNLKESVALLPTE